MLHGRIARDSPRPTYVGTPTDFVRGLRLEAIKPSEDGGLRREAKTSNLYPLTSNVFLPASSLFPQSSNCVDSVRMSFRIDTNYNLRLNNFSISIAIKTIDDMARVNMSSFNVRGLVLNIG